MAPLQIEYLEIGDLFLQKSGMASWFREFTDKFTFVSDCPLAGIFWRVWLCVSCCLPSG